MFLRRTEFSRTLFILIKRVSGCLLSCKFSTFRKGFVKFLEAVRRLVVLV